MVHGVAPAASSRRADIYQCRSAYAMAIPSARHGSPKPTRLREHLAHQDSHAVMLRMRIHAHTRCLHCSVPSPWCQSAPRGLVRVCALDKTACVITDKQEARKSRRQSLRGRGFYWVRSWGHPRPSNATRPQRRSIGWMRRIQSSIFNTAECPVTEEEENLKKVKKMKQKKAR